MSPSLLSLSFVAAVTHFESDPAGCNPPEPHPTRAVATPAFERTLTNGGDYSEWEETTRTTTATMPKRNEVGYWERVEGAFSRSTSRNGRGSRTDSVGGRPRDHADSSIRNGGTSPLPAHVSNDMSKYMNSKLFPFPGMMELERGSKAKAMLNSASSLDISSGADPASTRFGSSNATGAIT